MKKKCGGFGGGFRSGFCAKKAREETERDRAATEAKKKVTQRTRRTAEIGRPSGLHWVARKGNFFLCHGLHE